MPSESEGTVTTIQKTVSLSTEQCHSAETPPPQIILAQNKHMMHSVVSRFPTYLMPSKS